MSAYEPHSQHSSSPTSVSRVRSAPGGRRVPRSLRVFLSTMAATGGAFITLAAFGTQSAMAATATVNLGTASTFAVLAGSAITNTGGTTICGEIGIWPTHTGHPPETHTAGAPHVADETALLAENALGTASPDAAGRTPFNTVTAD